MAPDPDYSLLELAALADVSPRTIRFYIAQGLLPPPEPAGPGARYGHASLARLRTIRRLQRAHLPLAEIRRRLAGMPDEVVVALAEGADPEPAGSALEYVRAVLGGGRLPTLTVAPPPGLEAPPAPAPTLAPGTTAARRGPGAPGEGADRTPAAAGPDRSQWERIVLEPDIELHVRRPLSRPQNRRVERLVTFARQLQEEDRP